jgi:hypothetical protein
MVATFFRQQYKIATICSVKNIRLQQFVPSKIYGCNICSVKNIWLHHLFRQKYMVATTCSVKNLWLQQIVPSKNDISANIKVK